MKNIVKIITLLFVLVFLSNCRMIKGAGTPFLAGTNIKVPDGTPLFQKGFKDGCSTGLSGRGNSFYRAKYKFEYDHKYIDHPEYSFGAKRGYSYCFSYIIARGHLKKGNTSSAYLYEPGSINMFNNKGLNSIFDNGSLGTVNVKHGGFNGIAGLLSGGSGGSALGAHPLWAGQKGISIHFLGGK